QDATYPLAQDLQARLAPSRGLADVHLYQIVHAPALHVEVDRTRAVELGLMQRDVANNLLVTLSGSRFVSPNFWADPRTGIPFRWSSRRRNTGSIRSSRCVIPPWPLTARLSPSSSA